MNAVDLDHPTGTVLTAYSLGQLNEEELADIDRHLANCDICRQVAEGVAPDTLLTLLRSAATDKIDPPAFSPLPTGGEGSGVRGRLSETPPPMELTDHPRYRVGELLGVGGMGAVYKAEHLLMERPVALKVLNRELIDKPATIERFRREVRAAARLTHPNIVAAFDAEQAGDVHFLAMEYVEGVSLARRSLDHGPLPVAEACDYVRQAALGLQHAHECGMVHRDIKPQNLMLTPNGQVKILDFGLARFVMESAPAGALLEANRAPATMHANGNQPRPLTQTGLVMGTPDYIAPEQARDSHLADIRADIYSLGCTLYDLLAGHAPFPDGNAAQKVKAHLSRTPPPLKNLRRDVPPELVRVIERMMAKDPAQRYQTPVEVAAALSPFATAKPPRRRRWPIVAAIGFVVALIAGVVIYIQTDNGRIIIETSDDKIAVMIQKAGGVKIIDEANNRQYLLRAGEHRLGTGDYQIEVTEPLAGLEFSAKEFRLTRGGTVRVSAKFLPFGDDQNVAKAKSRLEKDWGFWIDPDGDCSFFLPTPPPDRLRIVVPGKPHLLSAEISGSKTNNAPRVLREIEGDFRAEVTVHGQFPSSTYSLVQGRWPFYAAGLLVWQDDNNYIRFERARARFRAEWKSYPNWQDRRHGELGHDLAVHSDSLDDRLPTILRLERKGATFTASYSQDGKVWTTLQPIKTDLLKTVRVGVSAIQNTPAVFEALFENLSITQGKTADALTGKKRAQERLKILKEIAAQREAQYQRGAAGFDEIFEAKREVAKAELELSQSDKERLSILERLVALADKLVEVRDASFQVGKVKATDLLQAKADLLEAQTALEKAKSRWAQNTAGMGEGPLYGGKTVSFWLEQYKDANPKFRAEAIVALGALAQKNKDLIPVLVGALEDKSEFVVSRATTAFEPLGPAAVPALIEVLKNANSQKRAIIGAMGAIDRIGPDAKAAVPYLSKALKADKWDVRIAAIHALSQIGPDAKSVIPAIVNILGEYLAEDAKGRPVPFNDLKFVWGVPNNSIAAFVHESLSKIDPHYWNLRKELGDIDYLYDVASQKDWPRFYDWLKKKYPATSATIPPLTGDNAQPKIDKKDQGPSYRGKPASFWLEQLKDTDMLFRSEAIDALGSIAQRNKDLIPVLVAALGDKSDAVGRRAAEVLGDFGPDVIPVLLEVLKDKTSQASFSSAAYALQRIGHRAKAAVPLLSQTLKIDDWAIRMSSVNALGAIGPDAKPAIPVMVAILGVFLKEAAKQHWSLPEYGQGIGFQKKAGGGKAKVGGLPPGAVKSRLSNMWLFPRALANALGRIDPALNDLLPKGGFMQITLEEETTRWQQVYDALKKRYPPPQGNDFPDVQGQKETVKPAPNNAAPTSKSKETSLLYRGKPARFWLDQLKDADAKLRAEAVLALGLIAAKDRDLIPVLVASMKDQDYGVASGASKALSILGPDVIPYLLDALKDKSSSPQAFSHAADALGRIGPEAKLAVPLLHEALKRAVGQDDWDIRRSAVLDLGRIGPEAKPALPAMIDTLDYYLKPLRREGKGIGRLASPNSWPRKLVEALKQVDPEIQKVLPSELYKDGIYRDGGEAPRTWDDLAKLWQQTYEVLKEKYQK